MFWMTQTAQYALPGRAWLAAVLCLAALLAWPLEANAASRLCRQLESQLADAGRGSSGGSPSQLRRYNLAIKAQRDQLQKARRIQRRSNCGSYDSDRGRNSCSGMASQLSRMERNLRSLEARRDELASGGGNPRRERARILAALDANGCRDASGSDQPREQVARRDNRNFFDRLFGNERRDRRYEDEEAPPITERERVRSNIVVNPDDGYGGSHRTLCVRTCDGYYWPISYRRRAAILCATSRTARRCAQAQKCACSPIASPSRSRRKWCHWLASLTQTCRRLSNIARPIFSVLPIAAAGRPQKTIRSSLATAHSKVTTPFLRRARNRGPTQPLMRKLRQIATAGLIRTSSDG